MHDTTFVPSAFSNALPAIDGDRYSQHLFPFLLLTFRLPARVGRAITNLCAFAAKITTKSYGMSHTVETGGYELKITRRRDICS